MVSGSIPHDYAVSPPIRGGLPHIKINHEAANDLDAAAGAFEGPEKLLEVWFSASPATLPAETKYGGLKAVPAHAWHEMLDLVNCKVLSIVESEPMDAYLLSESSMFVFPHKLILKTCGTTTLLSGLARILEIAASLAGFPHVKGDDRVGIATAATPYRVFYSRKNFLFPDRQRGPHRSWRDEVKSLDKLFLGGSAYLIGKMNGEHWYLYLTEPNTILTPPATPDGHETRTTCLELPESPTNELSGESHSMQDETLEILMTDLDEAKASQFHIDHATSVAARQGRSFAIMPAPHATSSEHPHQVPISDLEIKDLGAQGGGSLNVSTQDSVRSESTSEDTTTEGHALGTVMSDASGLSNIYPIAKYPGARVDAYLFAPCGFSANGVVPATQDVSTAHYFTVHVTPESHCSYASFETNVPCRQPGTETADIVEQVVRIFQPGRFSVTLFEAKEERETDECARPRRVPEAQSYLRSRTRSDHIPGYRRLDRIVHDLDGYELVFRYYERVGWQGGAPRLGEMA